MNDGTLIYIFVLQLTAGQVFPPATQFALIVQRSKSAQDAIDVCVQQGSLVTIGCALHAGGEMKLVPTPRLVEILLHQWILFSRDTRSTSQIDLQIRC